MQCIGCIPMREMNYSIPGVQKIKSILWYSLWWVGDSFSNPCLLIIKYTRYISSRNIVVLLLHGMKVLLESMHTIVSWNFSDIDWTKIAKSLIILSCMFSFFCSLPSNRSHCWEYVVETPWLLFCTQERYADMIVTFSLLFLP